MAGRRSLSDKLTGKSIEDRVKEVQVEIDQMGDKLKISQLICDIVIVVLGYWEIENFKK